MSFITYQDWGCRPNGLPLFIIAGSIRSLHLSRKLFSSLLCRPLMRWSSGSIHAIPSIIGYHLPHLGHVISPSSISSICPFDESILWEEYTSSLSGLRQSLAGQASISINQRFTELSASCWLLMMSLKNKSNPPYS